MSHALPHLTYLEAAVVGLIQGVSELFPLSSLGHNVLIPALVGGTWAQALNVAAPESPYLAFIVGLHVATALALIIYFWRDWLRIIGGFFTSIGHLRVRTPDEKLAWMIILATIPVGITGLIFEKEFRVFFGRAIWAGVFLFVNGLILLAGEKFRPRRSVEADHEQADQYELSPAYAPARERELAAIGARRNGTARHASGQRAVRQKQVADGIEADRRMAREGYVQGTLIGSAQILALLAGISRDGVVMVAGMFRGLSRQDAARFSFLLSAPVILAAGALKIPDLIAKGHGIYGPILLGSVLSGIGAYLSVRFLVRYFRTRTLTPFAIYCLVVGLGSVVYLHFVKHFPL
jgi:undecaprenyl-diphosphatase